MIYLTHGNILATVYQKASGNYVIEIKIGHVVSKTLINSVKFLRGRAEFVLYRQIRIGFILWNL